MGQSIINSKCRRNYFDYYETGVPDRTSTPYPVIHAVANPILRGLLDRKISEVHLQSSNKSPSGNPIEFYSDTFNMPTSYIPLVGLEKERSTLLNGPW